MKHQKITRKRSVNVPMANKVKLPEKSLPFFGIGLFFILLSVILSFVPGVTRGWGLNYIAGFDTWVIVAFYLCLCVFLLPPTNQYLVKQITPIGRKSIIATLRKHRYLLFVLISLCAAGCFYLLKIKYVFLGDLRLRYEQIEQGIIINEDYLSMWTLNRLYVWLHAHFNFTGLETVQLMDYIIGAPFIFFSLCTANLLGNTFLKKVAAFIVATLSCPILLQFCGYNDIYMYALLFLQLYFFTTLLYLKNKTPFIAPTLVLLTGIAFHLMLICLLPSLIFLFYAKVLWKYSFFRSKKTIGGIIFISLPFLYIAFKKFAAPFVLPLEAQEGFTLFSIAHYKEFFNSQLLGGGIGFLVWLMILIYRVVFKLKYNLTAWFFLISSFGTVGLIFILNPGRGSGDWDIDSFGGVVYNLSNACFLLQWYDEKRFNNIKQGILMIAGFSVLHTSMWIFTQKTDAAIRYVEHALGNDPAPVYQSKSSEMILGIMFEDNGLMDLSAKWLEKDYRKHPERPISYNNYARILLIHGRPEEAWQIYEEIAQKFPYYVRIYPILVNHYIEIQNYETLYQLLLQMESAYQQQPEHFTSKMPPEQIEALWKILAELRENREKYKI